MEYFLTKLDDGRQWLTDGHDFGIEPDAVPDLLEACRELLAEVEHAIRQAGYDSDDRESIIRARAALTKAKE